MVRIKKNYVKEGTINAIEFWLDGFETEEEKEAGLSRYIEGGMKFPAGYNAREKRKKLRYLLKEFISLCKDVEFNQRERIPDKLRTEALQYIKKVEQKLEEGINVNQNAEPEKTLTGVAG